MLFFVFVVKVNQIKTYYACTIVIDKNEAIYDKNAWKVVYFNFIFISQIFILPLKIIYTIQIYVYNYINCVLVKS